MDLHGPLHPDTVQDGGLCTVGPLEQFSWDVGRMADIEEPRCELRYDSAVRYVDSQINRFVETLQSAGRWDDTTLVVTGDHGEALHNRGQYVHPHHYLYDDLLHVPLIVREPAGAQEPHRTDRPFSLAWTHQLLSELAGVPAPEFPESTAESPLDGSNEEAVYADSISPSRHTVSVRSGGQKVILDKDTESERNKTVETYYVKVDQGERQTGCSVQNDDQLNQLAQMRMVEPSSLPELGAEMSNNVEDRLKGLGYMS